MDRETASSGLPRRDALIAGLVAGAVSLVLYLLTTNRHVACDDIAEFQTLSATGGIAHSGYPVPVMLLQLLGHLSFSTPAFRANLLSVFSGAGAVGLAAYAATRLGSRPVAAIVAALALAMSITMWEASTHAEVYACSLAIGATGWLVARRLADRPGGWLALGLGVLGGVGMLSHFITLALFPVVGVAILGAARRGRLLARHVAVAVAGFLLGLTPLLYMLAHDRPDQPMNYIHDTLRADNAEELSGGHPPTTRLGRAVWLLSARQYLGGYSFKPFADTPKRILLIVTACLLNEFPIWGVPLALFGFWGMVRSRSPGWPPLALWVGGVLFWTFYGAIIAVVRMFMLPCLWVLSLWIASALTDLGRRSRLAPLVAGSLLILTPLVRLSIAEPPGPIARASALRALWRIAPADWNPFSPDPSWDAYGRSVMLALAPRAVVLSCWEEGTTLRYFRYAEPLRDDVEILYHCRVPVPAFAAADSAGRPIFTTYEPTFEMTGGRPFHAVGRWPRGGLWRIE